MRGYKRLPVCPHAQHCHTKFFRDKKCFWFFPETFCVLNKCFPVCSLKKQSATMCPPLLPPLNTNRLPLSDIMSFIEKKKDSSVNFYKSNSDAIIFSLQNEERIILSWQNTWFCQTLARTRIDKPGKAVTSASNCTVTVFIIKCFLCRPLKALSILWELYRSLLLGVKSSC